MTTDIDPIKLLEVARCPNTDCIDGAIPHQVGEQEWEAEQCQWCYEREQATKSPTTTINAS